MLYVSLFLSFALLIINSFGFAKVYKRFFKNIEIIKCYTFGFISVLVFFCLPIVPLLLFSIKLDFLNYYFLFIQCILLIIYIINWRWFFISWLLDYKKIIVFILVLLFISLGWLLSYKLDFNGIFEFSDNDSIINFLSNNKDPKNINLFGNLSNLVERSLIYYLLLSFLSPFNLSIEEIKIFINVFTLVIYLFFASLVFVSIFYNDSYHHSLIKILLLLMFSFIFSLLNLAFSNNTVFFQGWLSLLIMLMIWIHYSKYNEISWNLSSIVVNLIIFMSLVLNPTFIVPFTIINIITLGISYYTKKQGATDYNFFNIIHTLIVLSLLVIKVRYLSIITLVICFIAYIFYIFYRTSNVGIRINASVDKFFYKWIFVITIFFVFAIFFSIIIYYSISGNFSNLGDNWIIPSFFNINYQSNEVVYLIINLVYWIINVFIFLYSIVFLVKQKKNLTWFNYMEISFISILIFWNPFSLDLLYKFINLNIFNVANIDLMNLFLIPTIPLFLNATKTCINNEGKNLYNLTYISFLSASSICSVALINCL